MITLGSPEIDQLVIPSKWEIKPFDLKFTNNLSLNHPYQRAMIWVYKDYDFYVDEIEGDILDDIDYFGLLDRYYRYGITFEDQHIFPRDRKLYEEEDEEGLFGIKLKDGKKIEPELLFVFEDLDFPPFRNIVRNCYSLKQIIYNNMKKIDLDDVDKGPINISEVEKWKRKVINQMKDRKKRLNLLDPNIYHSLITFVSFLNFEGRPPNKIDYDLSHDVIDDVDKKLNHHKDWYKHTKMYEDKIYKKISNYLSK